MVKLNEDFKPDTKFTGYLALITIISTVFIAICCCFWLFIPREPVFGIIAIICGAVLLALIIFIVIWARLYYKTVVYHLNETEMTWKRGVWFRKTGIVPYNRITNIDIVQGPLMRAYGISHLKIQTAGYSGKNDSEIRIEGIKEPEPLRQMIMDFVRNKAVNSSAVCTDYSSETGETADLTALLKEVRDIRRLLEKKT